MVYKIKDKNGKYYEIKDLKKFARHIFEFHSKGSSVHEEGGYFFIIDDRFRQRLVKFFDMNNNK